MSKHLANMHVSFELFRDTFHLPENTHIISISMNILHWGEIILTIENDELPEVQEGDRIPDATPRYIVYYGENGEALKIEREDWGIR